jgi:beta-glucosidase-like glycosyl hydrolase
MQMGAITENFGFEESLIKAVNAGCNILTISNNGKIYVEDSVYQAYHILMKAAKSGKIPLEKIDQSYLRITKLKKRFKIN